MSAITGVLGQKQDLAAAKLLAPLAHRGTAEAKTWNNDHASLAAIGLEEVWHNPGPEKSKDGSRAAVFDGQLTNLEPLRDDLAHYNQEEESEAALVLRLFEKHGVAAFDNLEGHFSIGIMDNQKAILVRDHLGVRPLYYGFSNGSLRFASEMKALVDACPVVHSMPPGSMLISDLGIFPLQAFKPGPIASKGAQGWASALRDLLGESVRKWSPNGSPAGVWLSGGVDSSIVAALAHQIHGKIHTFTAGLEGAPDLHYAEMVAKHLGTQHHVRVYGLKEALSVLEDVIFHLESFDAPLVRSSIGNYLVAQLAADHVPFVYSGEGGDELFAGYAYQKEYESPLELTLSVQRAIAALHNTALQRVDRSAAAHQTSVALPFLDPRVVRFALAIPSSLKIRGPEKTDKWPLRQALASALPGEVIWREKAKFWEGAGAAHLLTQHAEEQISDVEFAAERDLGLEGQIRSKEELLYYRIFRSHFGDHVPLKEIGRTEHV